MKRVIGLGATLVSVGIVLAACAGQQPPQNTTTVVPIVTGDSGIAGMFGMLAVVGLAVVGFGVWVLRGEREKRTRAEEREAALRALMMRPDIAARLPQANGRVLLPDEYNPWVPVDSRRAIGR